MGFRIAAERSVCTVLNPSNYFATQEPSKYELGICPMPRMETEAAGAPRDLCGRFPKKLAVQTLPADDDRRRHPSSFQSRDDQRDLGHAKFLPSYIARTNRNGIKAFCALFFSAGEVSQLDLEVLCWGTHLCPGTRSIRLRLSKDSRTPHGNCNRVPASDSERHICCILHGCIPEASGKAAW